MSAPRDMAAGLTSNAVTAVAADANKGAPVHMFDSEASPEEKAASIGRTIKVIGSTNGVTNKELSLDTSRGSITPTITISDVDKSQADEEVAPSQPQSTVSETNNETTPGAIPEKPVPDIPDWYRIGWRAVSGIDNVPNTQEEVDKGILAAFLHEQYYGDWYHNAGVIFFAVITSHFLTLFRMGWGALIVLLAFCTTYYTTSLARVRRRARDDIQRELVKTRLLSESESADWMNHFLDRFWLIYEPVLSRTITASVNQILSVNTPPFLDSLRIEHFSLGSKAPHIDSVRTFPKTPDDIVMMDWAVSFTPSDESELTATEIKKKMNPKIVLNIRLGKGFASAEMPVLLEDINFRGLMRVRLKLTVTFPHIQIVDLCFMEKPLIDYVLKPIGGETFGFDIANIPGLSPFIRDMTHGTLGPMMYDPNVFTLNLEQLLSGAPIDAAIGVLQITLHHARGLKVTKIGGGSPDPYVSLSINHRAEVARTAWRESTSSPTWHETKFLLINSLNDVLTLTLMDYNEHRKDSDLGFATFELSKLKDDATLEGITSPIVKDGKDRGELRFDVSFYPVLVPTKVDGKDEPVPETSAGIVRLTVHQAKDLDISKSLSSDLNPFAKVFLGSSKEPLHNTPRPKHTINPVWESATEFLCSDRASSIIRVDVIDDRDFLNDPVVGHLRVKLNDLLDAKQAGKDWWPLSHCKTGRVRVTAEWKPLNIAGSLQGADHYTPPIGVVRLWMKKATDLKNVEALGGKSDPYVRVLLRNIVMARTDVVDNNLNPEWDQIIYVPVHSSKEVIILGCMDCQILTKDRSLGSVELRVHDLVQRSTEDKNYPYVSTGRKEHTEPLRHDNKDNMFKGQLHFAAEFIPAMFLKDIRFDAPANEIEEAVAASCVAQTDGSTSRSGSEESLALSPSQNDVPANNTFKPTHTKAAKSTDTAITVDSMVSPSSPTGANPESIAEPKYEGAVLTKEELLKSQSGIIVFNLISGQLAKKARLEVLLDEGYWPVVVTPKARSTNAKFNMAGEGFVKELDFGHVWLKLNGANDDEKEDVIAEFKMDVKPFLEQCLDGPKKFTLCDKDGRNESTIEVEAKYVPVNITLEPRESVNNQGILRIDLIEGKGILPADRSGTSDPYAIFTLNGQKIFRSQTKKKTLSPDWNESFEVNILSRVGTCLQVEVFDWNQIEQSKSLGQGSLDLESLEPFQAAPTTVPLSTPKHGPKGEVHVNLMFQPSIIAKTRKTTSTFSSPGRAMTQVGGIPFDTGKGIVHGVGSAGKTVKSIFKREHTPSPSVEVPSDSLSAPTHDPPATQVSKLPDYTFPAADIPRTGIATAPHGMDDAKTHFDCGMLSVTVLAAKDLVGASAGDMVKPYVVIKVGEKEQKTKHTSKTVAPEWDESFKFLIGPDTQSFTANVFDHKTIGKDRLLGEAEIEIWRHLNLTTGTTTMDVWVELREGDGLLRLRLEFEKGRQGSILSAAAPSSSRFTSLRRSTTRERT
ncbi:tricalbin [Hysterangium stoloniferum]|nr:tricalbin [Hysterangium stoloniferum]